MMRRVILLGAGGILALVLAIVCGNVLGGVDTAAPPATQGAGKAKASPRPDTIREGTWVVGRDVKAGQYKTSGALDGLCYWHTARDTSDDTIVDQGVVDSLAKQGMVTLKNGQYFKTSGCAEWHIVK